MRKYIADIIICLCIIFAGIAIYAQLGGFDFILYDDMLSLYDPFVTSGLSLEKIGQVFYNLPDRLPYQVPIPAIVRLVLWQLFGGDPGMHHLFSLYAHLAVALLLFLFLRSATGKILESGFCAMLFTVHPINVEAVSWLAGYNGLLEALFLMIALVCYFSYIKNPSFGRYLLIFLPFILGLMCKPSIAILPALLLLLDYWPFRRFSLPRTGMKEMVIGFGKNKIILEKLPFLILVPIYITIEKLVSDGRLWDAKPVSWNFHPGSIVDFTFHLQNFFYPTGLAICRPDPPEASLWAVAVLGAVFLLLSALLLRKADARRHLITGWFWFLIASAPVIVMISLSGRPVEDHHLYIPLIGIFIMISFGLSSSMSGLKYGRYLFPVTGIFVLIPLLFMAHLQTGYWENSITIFNHAIEICPDNKKAHVILGDAYLGENKIDKAIDHYRRFIRISPDSALGHTKLAYALTLAGMEKEAARHYETALKLSPDYVPALHGLADLMIRLGETDKAIALYRAALKINPDLFQTHNNLALALYEQGHFREAYDHLNQAMKINPDYKTAARNLKIILGNRIDGDDQGPVERSGQNTERGKTEPEK